jgi:hypothetical protein
MVLAGTFKILTLPVTSPKSNVKVTSWTAQLYAAWRERRSQPLALNEQPGQPTERLLQAVWRHQRLRREALRLHDGRSVRVFHPGFLNREAGPDFHGAVVQVEGEPSRLGDVEVDLHCRCWRQHGHDRNPSFQNVVLHAVWQADRPVFSPTLELSSFLDASLSELAAWLGTGAAEGFPENVLGRCATPLGSLSAEKLEELLRAAALTRLQRKASDLEARAREAGWEQALWEGVLCALGYKQNAWPMLRMGELRPFLLAERPASLLHWQARLFGVSGLLPPELSRSRDSADGYLRRVWDLWWRERDQFSELILPAAAWRLHGLRPANHPLRRLALVAHWWTEGTLPGQLEQWFTDGAEGHELAASLGRLLQAAADDFWSWHWTLRGRGLKQAQPLAGPARVSDLAVNVLLPWFLARSRQGNNSRLEQDAIRRYLGWPATQDNSVLRLARQRLLGGSPGRRWNSAAVQQGLLQIVRDFCDHSDALCLGCPFPECVTGFAQAASPTMCLAPEPDRGV